MRELILASFAELGWAGLGWNYPKARLVRNGVEVDDLRDGLKRVNA